MFSGIRQRLFPVVVCCCDGAEVFGDCLRGGDEGLRVILVHETHGRADFGVRLHEFDGHAGQFYGESIASSGVAVCSVGSQFSSIIRILVIWRFLKSLSGQRQAQSPQFPLGFVGGDQSVKQAEAQHSCPLKLTVICRKPADKQSAGHPLLLAGCKRCSWYLHPARPCPVSPLAYPARSGP